MSSEANEEVRRMVMVHMSAGSGSVSQPASTPVKSSDKQEEMGRIRRNSSDPELVLGIKSICARVL